jgi:hypothetical protein
MAQNLETGLSIRGLTADTNTLQIRDSSNNTTFIVNDTGNVGIGTSSPSARLDVSGLTRTTTLQITSGATAGYVLTATDSLGNSRWQISTGGETFTGGTVTGFTYNNTNRLTISRDQGKSDLNVFINTMSGLTVNGNLIVSAKTTTLNLTSVNDALINDITVGKGNSSVSTNTAVGFNALSKNTIGDKNVALGYGTLSANTVGYSNVSVGVNSLKSNIGGTYNIAIGENALLASTGASTNIAIGWDSMATSNIDADNSHSIGIGVKSLYKNIGTNNIGIGYSTLVNNTSGLNNIAIGYVALEKNVSGSQNIAIGSQSGVDVQFSALTNTVVIGFNAKVTQSNSIILGNASDTNIKVGIGISAPSEKLEVSGKTKTTTLQVTNGATAGYVLTATDNLGNMSWQVPSGGGGGTFTGGTVAGASNFTAGLTASSINANSFTLNGVNYTSIEEVVRQGTGLTIHFSGKTIFNSPTSPASGNISGNTTNAKLGMIQKIYHQSGTEPTFPNTWVAVGTNAYFLGNLNIIFAEYVNNSWIEYWIVQPQP